MYIKYPKTFHLPWSLGKSNDDKTLYDLTPFFNQEIVVTEKMDGENSTLYSNGYTHARSIDSSNHVSRDWLKSFWSNKYFDLSYNMRICGENLFAKHSIKYDNLPSYFLGFSIWDGDICLSWKDTLDWFSLLGISPVREIYRGVFDTEVLKQIKISEGMEGYVVRKSDCFLYSEFRTSVVKWVRSNHVQTDEHWMSKSVERNNLGEKNG